MYFLEVGDEVTIQYNYCPACDDTVGWDEYEMDVYEGDTLTLEVENLCGTLLSPLSCGGERFRYDGWMWSTCWITNHVPVFTNREPDWEV